MTLSKNEIISRIFNENKSEEPIIVTPILDFDDQLGISGIDIRLGKQFIIFKEHYKDTISMNKTKFQGQIEKFQDEIIVPIGKKITLHPGKFIIGSTLEYISIPSDIECQVEGRSSWARLGLIVATATTIEPCYKGVITLELSNNGTIPVDLHPGIKIAQLIFHKVLNPYKISKEELIIKKYNLSIGPGKSKVYNDKHLRYFTEQ